MPNNQENDMSLIGHLTELRYRLLIIITGLVVCTAMGLFFAEPVLEILIIPVQQLEREPGRDMELTLVVQPDGTIRIPIEGEDIRANLDKLSRKRMRIVLAEDPEKDLPETEFYWGEKPKQQFYYHSPLDPFFMQLKVALILGILLSLPIIVFQVWLFINPGLKNKEKRIIKPMLSAALVLFPIGALFAFYIVQLVLKVMQSYQVENIDPLLSIFDYLSLLTVMMLAFGLIFELPLVIAIAARLGVVTPEFLRVHRRHAYVILAVAAMLLTPADPFSMLAAFFPLLGLYELSILLAKPMSMMHRSDDIDVEDVEEESTP